MNIYILIWVWSGQELNAMFNICHLNQIEVVDVAQKLSLFHKITSDKIMITRMGLCTTMCQLSTCRVMRARCSQQGFVSVAYIQTGSLVPEYLPQARNNAGPIKANQTHTRNHSCENFDLHVNVSMCMF